MATLQVKGMDDGLYEALKSMAKRESRSISQQVVALIKVALANPGLGHANPTRAFLDLAGTWEDPREPEQIVRELRVARRTGLRSSRLAGVFGSLDALGSLDDSESQGEPGQAGHD